jgi:hypothetical protein
MHQVAHPRLSVRFFATEDGRRMERRDGRNAAWSFQLLAAL